jgi:hypothetical protein
VQEFLLEIQRQDRSFPAEPNISCKLDSQSRITQNPRKIRKKKKKQIFPPCLPQTLEPKKTHRTQHSLTNGPTAKTRRDAPAFIWMTELVPEVQTQHPPNSEPINRSVLTKMPPRAEGLRPLASLHNLYRRIMLDTSPSSKLSNQESQNSLIASCSPWESLSLARAFCSDFWSNRMMLISLYDTIRLLSCSCAIF